MLSLDNIRRRYGHSDSDPCVAGIVLAVHDVHAPSTMPSPLSYDKVLLLLLPRILPPPGAKEEGKCGSAEGGVPSGQRSRRGERIMLDETIFITFRFTGPNFV